MRSTLDRIRHALAFEIIGLAIVTPLGALLFGLALADMGVIGIAAATLATAWTYVYNLGFDHALMALRGDTAKSLRLRIAHALLFEFGLLAILVPPIAWYLEIGLLEALVMDAALASFYVVYAFIFNLAYDTLFPVPRPALQDG
ncbi:PACE efflux transporter [Stappia sp. WLB 29]|uniref:PACE efflux transporter n=1 Tax=Stappia sp. WLB 29 TaxID=2925220 RepID=UPI0020BDA2DD|nr:PACE efflux transporter [Stappia sp. WLB 29]